MGKRFASASKRLGTSALISLNTANQIRNALLLAILISQAGCGSSLCGKCNKDSDCDDGQSCRYGTCSYTTGHTQCCNGSPCDQAGQ